MLGVLGFSVSLIIEWWDDRSYTPREPDLYDILDKHIELYTLTERAWLQAHHALSQGDQLVYLQLIGVAEEKKPTPTHSTLIRPPCDCSSAHCDHVTCIKPASLGYWPHEMTDAEIVQLDGSIDRYILDYPPML
jgi:hypothetical protein